MKRALNEKSYVEELSGLAEVNAASVIVVRLLNTKYKQVQRAADRAMAEMEFDDDALEGDEGVELI